MSPALAGGFLTTAPPGKSGSEFLIYIQLGVTWHLVLKVRRSLRAGQDENLSNGFIKDLLPRQETQQYWACCVLLIPIRNDPAMKLLCVM